MNDVTQIRHTARTLAALEESPPTTRRTEMDSLLEAYRRQAHELAECHAHLLGLARCGDAAAAEILRRHGVTRKR